MNMKRKKPIQKRSKNTVEIILIASRQILLQDGPLKFSTNTIAKKSGVSIGSIYQYFQSKEKIIEALIEKELAESIKKFDEELRKLINSSFQERICGVINNLSGLFSENEYLLQAQKLFSLSDGFNLDQFFEKEILGRVKNIFSYENDNLITQEIEKILILSKQIFTPFAARPSSQAVVALNSVAAGIIQIRY